jgi:4-amino-4-deoxy-L-arabinose transferase-like glycosyltransferase
VTRRLAPWAALLVVLVSLGFRWPQLGRWELHIDESLYADVTRHVIERGDLLVNGAKSDKPPLLYWAQAPFMLALGPTEIAARMPGLLAWLLGACLCWRLLAPRWGRDAALAALVVWCLSPYGILHMSTGFTDPLMAAAGLGGWLFLIAGRPWEAGFCLALSLASKQTGLLYLGPAALLLPDKSSAKSFAKGYAWVLLPLLIWSALIADPKLGIWSRAAEYAHAAAEAGEDRGSSLLLQMRRCGGLLLGALVLAAAVVAPRRFRAGRVALLSLLAYAAFLFLSHGRLYDRYWLWALPALAVAAAAGIRVLPSQARLAIVVLLAALLSWQWWTQGRDWQMGAENNGFAAARAWTQGQLQVGDTLYLAGQVKPQGWKALFYFHPAKGQGLRQQQIDRLSEAQDRGWVLAYKADLSGRPPDFDSGQGLALWRVQGSHGL